MQGHHKNFQQAKTLLGAQSYGVRALADELLLAIEL